MREFEDKTYQNFSPDTGGIGGVNTVIDAAPMIPQNLMGDIYTAHYVDNTTHGPEESRFALRTRALESITALGPDGWMLDLGSGRQIVERDLLSDYRGQVDCKIATIDIANIRRRKLLAGQSVGVHHIRGDGAQMPFADDKFDVVVSQMGLELMPEEAIGEMYRVMKPGGKAFINVLHSSIVEWKTQSLKEKRRKAAPQQAQQFWDYYAREGNLFNRDPESIQEALGQYGFITKTIREVDNDHTAWIEIDLVKPTELYKVPEWYKSLQGSDTQVLAENSPVELESSKPFMFQDIETMSKEDQRKRLQIERELAEIMNKPKA